jgi:hypothetical protein
VAGARTLSAEIDSINKLTNKCARIGFLPWGKWKPQRVASEKAAERRKICSPWRKPWDQGVSLPTAHAVGYRTTAAPWLFPTDPKRVVLLLANKTDATPWELQAN